MSEYNDEWDDDEIVPLGDLRPSREHFGPVPTPRSVQQRQMAEAKAQKEAELQRHRGAPPGQGQPPRSRQAPPQQQAPTGQPRPVGPVPTSSGARGDGRPPRRPSQTPTRSDHRPSRQMPPQQPRSGGQRRRSGRNAENENFLRHLADDHNPAPLAVKPTSGWRNVVLRASGGVINLGLSSAERQELTFRQQTRRPVVDGTVAVFSRKGGVGKTTISAYLGLTLAAERGGRIVALDGDAEAGSLGWLLAPKAPSTLAALASANPLPSDYSELRRFTISTPEGLEVIVGDPAEMGPISTIGMEAVADQLARHYDVSIFDTGAGVTRATGRVLVHSARVLLLVMGPSVDSVRAAERTLAWIDERPGEAARDDAQVIAVINGIPSDAKSAHIDRIASHFADRCNAVVRVPWDAHLAAGNTSVSLDHLAKSTRRAFLELAATTVGTLAKASKRATVAGGQRVS